MNLQAWRDRLKPGDLPIFRHTHATLRTLSPRRESIAARDVAHVVLADPLATLHLLHSLNLRVLERYGTEVTGVEQALMLQGLGAYLDAAGRLPVVEDSPAGQDAGQLAALQALTRRAQHAAWQARDFAVLHADVRAEEVEVAALLAHVPEYLLWLRTPDTAAKLRRLCRHESLANAVQQGLGVPLADLRLGVLADWSIPPVTLDLLAEQGATRARPLILAACLNLAERCQRGWWEAGLATDYAVLGNVANVPLDEIIRNVHANAVRVARHGQWLTQPPAAAWLPMIPGPWPHEPDAERHAAPAAKAPATMAAPARVVRHAGPPPGNPLLRQALKQLETGNLDDPPSLNRLCGLILKGLRAGLGLERALIALITPDGQRLRCRLTQGVRAEDPLRQFEFPLASRDLFGQLMARMQGVWINPDNRARLWPLVRPELRQAIGAGDFYAMSLHTDNGPFGLVYADGGQSQAGLDADRYRDFKLFCQLAADELGKALPADGA